MSKKKPPTTIEECNAEMELTQKKIRQYENRNKMLDRKLAIEKRKERNHRLCSRGGYLESLVPALIDMSEQEARDFLYTAVFSDKAQEFLIFSKRKGRLLRFGNSRPVGELCYCYLNNIILPRLCYFYLLSSFSRSPK